MNQKLGEFQLIAVNDGSTDGSLEILEKYAEKHDNFLIVNQKNEGLSAARNAGIKHAKGQFVYSMDSDDLLSDSIAYIFKHIATMTDVDIFTFDAEDFENDVASGLLDNPYYKESLLQEQKVKGLKNVTCEIDNQKRNIKYIEFSGMDYLRLARKKDQYVPVAWKRLYRRKFLVDNKLSYVNEISHAEDDMYLFPSLLLNPRVIHYYETVIWHRVRIDSITGTIDREKSLKSFSFILNNVLPDLKRKYTSIEQQKILNWVFDVFIRRKHRFQPTVKGMVTLVKLARDHDVSIAPLSYLKMLARIFKKI